MFNNHHAAVIIMSEQIKDHVRVPYVISIVAENGTDLALWLPYQM